MSITTETGLELTTNQVFENLLHQLFDAPISLKMARQSPREIICSYTGREVLIDSPELHEFKGIPISLRAGDYHIPYYQGKILSTDKLTFRFRLTESPNKDIKDIPYNSIKGIIILLREKSQISGAKVYTNP